MRFRTFVICGLPSGLESLHIMNWIRYASCSHTQVVGFGVELYFEGEAFRQERYYYSLQGVCLDCLRVFFVSFRKRIVGKWSTERTRSSSDKTIVQYLPTFHAGVDMTARSERNVDLLEQAHRTIQLCLCFLVVVNFIRHTSRSASFITLDSLAVTLWNSDIVVTLSCFNFKKSRCSCTCSRMTALTNASANFALSCFAIATVLPVCHPEQVIWATHMRFSYCSGSFNPHVRRRSCAVNNLLRRATSPIIRTYAVRAQRGRSRTKRMRQWYFELPMLSYVE